jgi:hypothetical protein
MKEKMEFKSTWRASLKATERFENIEKLYVEEWKFVV